ncbi:MAG: T9SS type A sorting domain-containing protein [Bacteroidota bacterium]
MKKLLLLVLATVLVMSFSFGQYQYDPSFPPGNAADTLLKGVTTHGIAVDKAGKIWVIPFAVVKGDSVLDKAGAKRDSSVKLNYPVYAIRVFNPNGTQAAFSPIKILSGAGINDTLWASGTKAVTQRGIQTDKDGNILYSSFDRVFRINSTTGAAMGKLVAGGGNSITQVAADTVGNIFTTQVSPGLGGIYMYDASFTKQGNVTDTTRFFSRTMAASKAGDKVYYGGYTGHAVIRYTGDPLFGFTADTVLKGFDCESINRHGKTDWLWASTGSGNDMPNRYPGVATAYKSHTWYLWNPADNKIKDSITWSGLGSFTLADSQGIRPRGVATTQSGDTVYVTMFGAKAGLYSFQRFIKKSSSVSRQDGIVAGDYSLSQNYPNPFNPSTKLKFTLKNAANVSLTVYDVLGKEISTLASGNFAAGSYDVDFNASNLSAGVYFYTLKTSNGFTQTKKMLLVK